MLRLSPWHPGDVMLQQWKEKGKKATSGAVAQARLFALSCNHLQTTTIRCCCTAMHARNSPSSLTFQLAFNNRHTYQVIPLVAVAIKGFDAVFCDAPIYVLKALVTLTRGACSASWH